MLCRLGTIACLLGRPRAANPTSTAMVASMGEGGRIVCKKSVHTHTVRGEKSTHLGPYLEIIILSVSLVLCEIQCLSSMEALPQGEARFFRERSALSMQLQLRYFLFSISFLSNNSSLAVKPA
jgi:hypothetical protein